MLEFKIIALEDEFIVVEKSSGIGFHDEKIESVEKLVEESECGRVLGNLDTQSNAAKNKASHKKIVQSRDGQEQGLMPGLCSLLNRWLAQEQGPWNKCYPVHRLDKNTSGLLVFARNPAAAALLSEEFSQRRVKKYYMALSDKKPKKKQGQIIGDMAKSRRSCWKLLNSKGSPAKTQFFSHSISEGLRLFILRPYTGKTHQLRVAMKSVGSPICGDTAYGGSGGNALKPFERLFLHSFQLEFTFKGRAYKYQQLPDLKACTESDFRFDWYVNEDLSSCIAEGFERYQNPDELYWSLDKVRGPSDGRSLDKSFEQKARD